MAVCSLGGEGMGLDIGSVGRVNGWVNRDGMVGDKNAEKCGNNSRDTRVGILGTVGGVLVGEMG